MPKPKNTNPHSLESEAVVLASCLLSEDGSVYDETSQIVQHTDFYSARHATIYATMGKIVGKGLELSEITLLEQLRSDGVEDNVGGILAIYEIQEACETPTHAKYAANVVREKSKLRQTIRHCRLAIEEAETGEMEVDVITSKLEGQIQVMYSDKQEDSTISIHASEIRNDLQSMMDGTYQRGGLRMGIPVLDEFLPDGLEPGTVTVIAAPTSVGKSQLALNIALKNCVTDRLAGGIFSYEMLSKQLTKRILRTTSGVNLARFRDQVATESDQQKVESSIKKLEDTIILTDHRHKSADSMCALARQWKRKHDIKILVIDYLQRMDSPNSKMQNTESVAYNSKKIKDLALELDIPILELSQVNREAVKRLAFNPEGGLLIHDLIGGSAIECDSDNCLIFWPKCGDPANSRAMDGNGNEFMQIRGQWAKFREGRRGERFDMKFIENTGRFQ